MKSLSAWRKLSRKKKVFSLIGIGLAIFFASTLVSIWPDNYFWVNRENATMPVWVKGNIDSGVFIVFNHGGPGSSGTLESIIEVNPGNGQLGHPSPLKILEDEYAMVYWDQRHSGMSKGSADPNDSRPEDFGEDLAVVINELKKRYDVQKLFIIGQSWGHTVATSYLTYVDQWKENQANVDGYIIYKGVHSQDMTYQAAKLRILSYAEKEISEKRNISDWQEVRDYYQNHTRLTEASDFMIHEEYAHRVMGVSISLFDRINTGVKASFCSPYNGWSHYPNFRATMSAEKLLSWIVSDNSFEQTINRIAIPTLIIYGGKDLIAPSEVGENIYNEIETAKQDKVLVILRNSRHGAENNDVVIFQEAIKGFIEQYR
jgi:pimeloyl-ACP methyl ester carboxylesterase